MEAEAAGDIQLKIPVVIPGQIRGARALIGWSQKQLAERAKVGVTTVRDMEEGKRADTGATVKVIEALIEVGVGFIDGSDTHGPGVQWPMPRAQNL